MVDLHGWTFLLLSCVSQVLFVGDTYDNKEVTGFVASETKVWVLFKEENGDKTVSEEFNYLKKVSLKISCNYFTYS